MACHLWYDVQIKLYWRLQRAKERRAWKESVIRGLMSSVCIIQFNAIVVDYAIQMILCFIAIIFWTAGIRELFTFAGLIVLAPLVSFHFILFYFIRFPMHKQASKSIISAFYRNFCSFAARLHIELYVRSILSLLKIAKSICLLLSSYLKLLHAMLLARGDSRANIRRIKRWINNSNKQNTGIRYNLFEKPLN